MQQFGWIILCQCTWFFMFKYCCYIPSRMFRLAKLTSNHNYLHRLVSKQSRSSKYLFCISYSVCSNSHTTPVRIYGEPYVHKFCAVNILFGISPVVKHYNPLPSSITCWGVVSWFSGWYWFLSNVSQPIRINYFTWKYNIWNYYLLSWNDEFTLFQSNNSLLF